MLRSLIVSIISILINKLSITTNIHKLKLAQSLKNNKHSKHMILSMLGGCRTFESLREGVW